MPNLKPLRRSATVVHILFGLWTALACSGCGSSGGTLEPPAPPGPMAAPAPPPAPTFEERLANLAAYDPNPCRAQTPGFEALGGWLKNAGRDIGKSRVWVEDAGDLADPESHGATVWSTLTACAIRSNEDQYFSNWAAALESQERDGGDLIKSFSFGVPEPIDPNTAFPEPGVLPIVFDGTRDGQRVLQIQAAGNSGGYVAGELWTEEFQAALRAQATALWILVAGYTDEGSGRQPDPSTSICGEADPLCLYAPFVHGDHSGTSIATPQVSAALDTVWAVWPEMDILDLRNLAFDCAENMPARTGDTSAERAFSYSNGRSFTSTTNSTWGHGILSLTCLFTPNGGLQNPVTGNPISGGIFGPVAGPVTGGSITGVDYTGRDFDYGFAHPVARENFALAAIANLRPVQRRNGFYGVSHTSGAFPGRLWQGDAVSVNLTAAGNAIGVTTQWQTGNLTIRGGVAAQPEGVGSLTGSRAFRAPSTVSAAITAAYGRTLPHGFTVHLQADHWQTVSTQGRSLWQSASLSESRVSAALVKRFAPREGAARHELALQVAWQSGLVGSLDVDGKNWPVAGVRDRGMWLTWRVLYD